MAKDTDPNPFQPPLDEGRGGPARRRWTVLFIGDHGKVVAFKRIKTVIGLTLAALVAALAAVAVLLVVNQRLHGRGRDLQQRLEESRRQIESLSHEKDLLTLKPDEIRDIRGSQIGTGKRGRPSSGSRP